MKVIANHVRKALTAAAIFATVAVSCQTNQSDSSSESGKEHFVGLVGQDSLTYCDTRFSVCFRSPKSYSVINSSRQMKNDEMVRFENGGYPIELIQAIHLDSNILVGATALNFTLNTKKIQQQFDSTHIRKQAALLDFYEVYTYFPDEFGEAVRLGMRKFPRPRNLKMTKGSINGVAALISTFDFTVFAEDIDAEIDYRCIQTQFLHDGNLFSISVQVPHLFYYDNEAYYLKISEEFIKPLRTSLKFEKGKGVKTYQNELFTQEVGF